MPDALDLRFDYFHIALSGGGQRVEEGLERAKRRAEARYGVDLVEHERDPHRVIEGKPYTYVKWRTREPVRV